MHLRKNKFIKERGRDIFLVSLIILIAIISFNLGRITAFKEQKQPIRFESADIGELFKDDAIQNNENLYQGAKTGDSVKSTSEIPKIDFRVVVSKKSKSMKYHFLWCSGAKQINEENKVFFKNEEDAQKAGYSLAGNCRK